ncbi:ornithine cyclodeaminase family protein [Roseiterribacter gracilis]|uniref:Ornithine cyclodeaminase n=1 Tax=Roseiterribacter gracilis TaxID=2812848 RepID=A0A8S8XGH0_9PROT|nr:ornithine cyclodeaminase [Rhodospirillales bacterium TMPK1]
MNAPAPMVIDGDEVSASLSYPDCIEVVRDAMIALSQGRTRQVLRTIIPVGDHKAFGVMPGALGLDDFFGAKILSVFHDKDRPTRSAHRGFVLLFEGENGFPVCLADAEQITRIRTAAASAAATDALARKDASVLTIFGAGMQARSHIEAIACVRDLSRVVVWGRTLANAQAFAAEAQAAIGLPVTATTDGKEAAQQADIICTVTGAREPILFSDWVRDGTHINVVGSSGIGPIEIDTKLVQRVRFFAESRAATAQYSEFQKAKEQGVITDDHVVAEIGEVLGGKPGRTSQADVTLYKSIGHIVQDLAAASVLYRQRLGLTEIS